jgi:hypothetical protein
MHQPVAYGMPQPAGYTTPYSVPQPQIGGQPTVNMRLTPREPGLVQQPFNFNVPTTVDAGYGSGNTGGRFPKPEKDDFFSSYTDTAPPVTLGDKKSKKKQKGMKK